MRKPHSEKQYQLITYPGNVAIFAGRRWGKTDGYVQRIYYWGSRNPGLYWWVGLSWQSASMKRAWRAVTHAALKIYYELGLDPRKYINRTRHEVIIPGLGDIWFRTADNPASLAGEGVKGAVFDEFSLAREDVWTEYLRATLLDYKGWIGFGGVPKGINWASILWQNAADWDGWIQIHATTYENPFIDPKEVDKIKRTSTQRIFEQEYLAQIVQGEGIVFRNITACLHAPDPADMAKHKGHQIVAGVDWAKQNDFTAISIGCRDCQVEIARDRFNKIDYAFQVKRLEEIIRRYDVQRILVELNSIGEPNFESLQRMGLPVIGFQTTAKSKPPLIENLALALQAEEWQFQNDKVWTGELEAYEVKINDVTNRATYSAPEGMHDDTVVARALMLRAAGSEYWYFS